MSDLLQTKHLALQLAKKIICSRLDFTLRSQEIWGILGPNGSGKTTLLHTLAGLMPTWQGTILLQEKNILHLSKKIIAQQLGILFQDTPIFFPQTVEEFCLSGRFPHKKFFGRDTREDHEQVAQALAIVELTTKSKHYTYTLSGGERRRLAIATLLAQAPAVYLLDEPTNHLDLRQQMNVLQYFQQHVKEKDTAVMMTLHEPRLALRYCTHVMLLFADGNVLTGTAQQVLTEGNIAKLYGILEPAW